MALETYSAMPVLALRGLVVFPGMNLHFDVGREKSVNALNIAMKSNQLIFLVSQKDIKTEYPEQKDLYKIGCISKIKQIVHLADDNIRVLIEGMFRARFSDLMDINKCLMANVTLLKEISAKTNAAAKESALRNAHIMFDKYVSLSPKMPKDVILTVIDSKDPGFLSDYIASNVQLTSRDKQHVLEQLNHTKRLNLVTSLLNKECNILTVDAKINKKAKELIDESQKEYYLREQLRAINYELYGDDDPEKESGDYALKIKNLKADGNIKKQLLLEVQKLSKMPQGSHEATVVRNYLDTVLALPFGIETKLSKNITKAEKILNKEHYGLKDIKEEILDFMAVFALNPNINAQIICLVGPPGVGKTSIAKSLAECSGRKFARVSLGGVHDEAEINGHRRTYIGAMPGKIIKAIKNAGSSNPLILLDEIDKMGADIKGDPSAALLEVLDSEQNSTYTDHYIDLPFDLSKVLFVCTANNINNIPSPLLDRMDVVNLAGYTRIDKYNIANKHLIKKQLKKYNLTSNDLKIDKSAVFDIIDYYTREAGVRNLERYLIKIIRKATREILKGKKGIVVNSSNLKEYLGNKKYGSEDIFKEDLVGTVNGLAFTKVGGTLMQLEVAVMDGTGKIELTGSLGDVMKESAKTAVSYVRTKSDILKTDKDFYKTKDIHIHATQTAVPKDGPSAGITIMTALVSALTDIPIKRDVAMTGEITVKGRVTAIGGLKEKCMAAARAGIKTVIIPKENEKDLEEFDDVILKALKFYKVETAEEVLKIALTENVFVNKENNNEKTKTANNSEDVIEITNDIHNTENGAVNYECRY